MNNSDLVVERTYNAPVAKVWKAITNNDDMKQWYFQLPEFRAETGFAFSFTGGPDGGPQYVHECRVTEVVPGKKITYSWAYKGYEGISHVSFELFDEQGKTRLKLTHSGLGSFEANNSPDFDRKSFEAGWNSIAGEALRKFVEA